MKKKQESVWFQITWTENGKEVSLGTYDYSRKEALAHSPKGSKAKITGGGYDSKLNRVK